MFQLNNILLRVLAFCTCVEDIDPVSSIIRCCWQFLPWPAMSSLWALPLAPKPYALPEKMEAR